MKQTKKVLALVCALAMILSMFSVFTMAQAADEVALIVDVLEDTTTTQDNGIVKLQYRLKGITSLTGLTIKLPTDNTKFTCDKTKDIVIGETLKNGSTSVNVTSAGKVNLGWNSTDAVTIDESTVLATITLIAPTMITEKQTLEVEASSLKFVDKDGVAYTSEKVTTSPIEVSKPEMKNNLIVDVIENGTKKDEKVVLQYRLKGITSLTGLTIKLPTDNTKFSCDKTTDIVVGDILKNGSTSANVTSAGKVNLGWNSTDAVTIDENTVLATITLTLLEDLASDIKMDVEASSLKFVDKDGLAYTSADVGLETIVISANPQPEVPSDPTDAPSDPTDEPSEAPTEEPTSYEYKVDVKKTTNTDQGTEYKVTIEKNGDYTGTENAEFDVVIQAYDKDGVGKYYMVFNDITVDTNVSFFIPGGHTASVNVNDNNGEVIAKPIAKQ